MINISERGLDYPVESGRKEKIQSSKLIIGLYVVDMCTYADAIEKKVIAKVEYISFKNCMDRKMSFDDAKSISGASDEDAAKYLEKWRKENHQN